MGLAKKTLLYGLLLLPVAAHAIVAFRLSVNIPITDDYTLLTYLSSPIHARLGSISSLNADHRIFFTRLMTEILFQTLGSLDFRHLILIGNVGLIFIFYLLHRLFKRTQRPILYFLPVSYLLFLGGLGENAAWAVASTQHHYVQVFSLLALMCFEKNSSCALLLSIAWAMAAALTSGAGLFLLISLFAWSLLKIGQEPLLTRRAWMPSIGIASITTLCLVFYFLGFNGPPHKARIFVALENPLSSLKFFLAFCGGFMGTETASLVAGAVNVLIFIGLTARKYFLKTPVIYFFFLFLLLSAGGATLTRSYDGIQTALRLKYAPISVLMVISCYFVFMASNASQGPSVLKYLPMVFLVFLIAFIGSFKERIQLLERRKRDLSVGMSHWKATGIGLEYVGRLRGQTVASIILWKALSKGIYHPPPSSPNTPPVSPDAGCQLIRAEMKSLLGRQKMNERLFDIRLRQSHISSWETTNRALEYQIETMKQIVVFLKYEKRIARKIMAQKFM